MKYSIQLYKKESKEVQVFAENHEAARELALQSNPGFDADDVVTELGEDDEPVRDFELYAVCEGCEKRVWEENGYQTDEEGMTFCNSCIEDMLGPDSP